MPKDDAACLTLAGTVTESTLATTTLDDASSTSECQFSFEPSQFPVKDNSDEEDVLFTPPSIPKDLFASTNFSPSIDVSAIVDDPLVSTSGRFTLALNVVMPSFRAPSLEVSTLWNF